MASAYEKFDKAALNTAVDKELEQLKKDGNLGLAYQAMAALDKHRIRQLTEVRLYLDQTLHCLLNFLFRHF